ncbi:MAG: endonuclease/exonuclease/phosphatase family protein [Anaerolineales bacterium]
MKPDTWKAVFREHPAARILDISLWVYAASLLLWLFARKLTSDESAFVLVYSYLGVWLFAPLLVFGPWVYRNRSKSGLVLLIIPVALFLWFYGSQFLPKSAQTVEIKKPLSVLTFNLLHTNTEIEPWLEVLGSRQVDVLALQEVTSYHDRQLSLALDGGYPYQWYYEPGGLAIYSAHPILSEEIYPTQLWPIQSLIVQVRGTPVHIINAHLAKPGILLFLETWDVGVVRGLAAARLDQIAKIKQAIADRDLPTIVNCDCNMTNLTTAYTQMTSDLLDAFQVRGWGLGHTFLLPRGFELRSGVNLAVQRIDYIFHSPEIIAAEAEVVGGDRGSDHRPVWARLELNP